MLPKCLLLFLETERTQFLPPVLKTFLMILRIINCFLFSSTLSVVHTFIAVFITFLSKLSHYLLQLTEAPQDRHKTLFNSIFIAPSTPQLLNMFWLKRRIEWSIVSVIHIYPVYFTKHVFKFFTLWSTNKHSCPACMVILGLTNTQYKNRHSLWQTL